jgi:hypothetical protein
MQRRVFLKVTVLGLAGCSSIGDDRDPGADATSAGPDGAGGTPPDGGAGASDAIPGAPDAAMVMMYDTYAQALYMDGTLGPLTGVIEAAYVRDGEALTLDFWHGHGGQLHRFTLTAEHYAALACGERVYVTTSVVDGHMHELFIDPTDPGYRVPGATPVPVPLRKTC